MHKGLRTWLFETGIKIQETDFLLAEEGKATITVLRDILLVIERKSSIDESFVFPVLVKHAPFFVNLMDAENRRIQSIADQLRSFLGHYIQPGSENYQVSAGFSIQAVYNDLMSAQLSYMNRMEYMLNELQIAESNDDIKEQLEKALLLNLDFGTIVMPKEWIFKSLSDNELDGFLGDRKVLENEWLSTELSRLSANRFGRSKGRNQRGLLLKMAAA